LLLLLINLGVMSLGIGILGEYIARIYSESKRRPLWLVDYMINMSTPAVVRPLDGASAGSQSAPRTVLEHEDRRLAS
jgi:hypothetical protein